MNITRREFAKLTGVGSLALAGTGALALEGCDVWNEIQAWVPAAISAFEQIVTLVAPLSSPAIVAIAQTVEAGFSALAAAVNQYINAPAASKATFADKVRLIFSQLTGDIQAFLSAINESANPVVKLALALVSIIVSTIMGFMSRIGTSVASPSLKVGAVVVSVTPAQRNRKQFVSAFNSACTAGGHPELQIN
jgi:hypothetical protein